MTKLMDYAYCDEPTEKRPAIQKPLCDGFDIEKPCTAFGELELEYADGRKRQFCKLHHYVEAIWEATS